MQAFLDYIQYEKRYSVHTLKSYENDLRQFELFLIEEYESVQLKEANHQMIRSWTAGLMEANISPRTINRKISSLKTYYRFLMREGKRSDNPTNKVVAPKTSKRLPDFVEQNKMERLFHEGLFEEDFSGWRDRMLLELLYGTGIRLSELINLKEADFENTQIKVLGKRNKERWVPVPEIVSETMIRYRSEKQNLGLHSPWFFVTDKGNKLYEKFVYRKVNHYLGKVTTSQKKSPHVLRHTFATHLLNSGAQLNAIKEMLGHANLSATQVYTHNTIDKLKNIHQQAHPRA